MSLFQLGLVPWIIYFISIMYLIIYLINVFILEINGYLEITINWKNIKT